MLRIKDLREDLDMKQSELAKIIGIPQTTLSNYETGKTNADYKVLIKLADFFEVSIDYLLGRTNDPSKKDFTEGLTEEEIKELQHYKELLQIKRKVENNKKISTSTNVE